MGTLSHGVCFDDATDASNDYLSRFVPFGVGSDVANITASSGYIIISAGSSTAVIGLPTCDPALYRTPFNLTYADGAAVSAAVASVWIAAVVWRYLLRTLKDRQDGD